jgi:hypothetical protein
MNIEIERPTRPEIIIKAINDTYTYLVHLSDGTKLRIRQIHNITEGFGKRWMDVELDELGRSLEIPYEGMYDHGLLVRKTVSINLDHVIAIYDAES